MAENKKQHYVPKTYLKHFAKGKLYSVLENEFSEFDLGLDYKPHMTIGKLPTVEELDIAYEQLKEVNRAFKTIVNKVSVEMIGENEESIIILEHKL